MTIVNVKEARSNLSELLDRVEKGEVIQLSRRGSVIARLLPPETKKQKLPSLSSFRSSLGKTGSKSAKLIREEREER